MQKEVQSYIGFKIQNIIGKTNIFQQEKYFWVNFLIFFLPCYVAFDTLAHHLKAKNPFEFCNPSIFK
jgi:hypothetical protein